MMPFDSCTAPNPLGEVLEGYSAEQAAHHEIGHVYISLLYGAKIRCVRILPAKKGYIGLTVSTDGPVNRERNAVVALSGMVGQWLVDGVGRPIEEFKSYAKAARDSGARLDFDAANRYIGLTGSELESKLDLLLDALEKDILGDPVLCGALRQAANALLESPAHQLNHEQLVALLIQRSDDSEVNTNDSTKGASVS